MATKAELESELADLKRQLAERPKPEPAPEVTPESDIETSDAVASEATNEDAIDWEAELGELVEQFDDLTHKKPLLFALGAFTIGYLLGRSK